MPKITIKNRENVPVVKKGAKVKDKRSNFFITINTNQNFNEFSEEYEVFDKKLVKSLNSIYENIKDYVIFKDEKAKWNDVFIKEVDIDSATEIGPKSGKAHAHAMIKIKHTTLLQLDYAKIRSTIMTDLKLKGIYINNKVFHDNNLSLQEYIGKQH